MNFHTFQARIRGHSLFPNDLWRPWDDQWAFLSTVTRITRAQAEAMLAYDTGVLAATAEVTDRGPRH